MHRVAGSNPESAIVCTRTNMTSRKPAAKDFSCSLGEAPNFKGLREATGEQICSITNSPIGKTDPAADFGKAAAQPSPSQYDPLPCLHEEPEGGLRWVSISYPMRRRPMN